jgi:hypothetical protein
VILLLDEWIDTGLVCARSSLIWLQLLSDRTKELVVGGQSFQSVRTEKHLQCIERHEYFPYILRIQTTLKYSGVQMTCISEHACASSHTASLAHTTKRGSSLDKHKAEEGKKG